MFHRKKNKELLANYRVLAKWVNIYFKECSNPVPDFRFRHDIKCRINELLDRLKNEDPDNEW